MRDQPETVEVKRRFRLVPFDEIARTTSCSYLVRDIIPREGLIVVWGSPKCGKTFKVFDIAMHVALGWPYRGRKVTGGTVVYVACEGERGLAARVEAFRMERLGDLADKPKFFLLTTRLDLAGEQSTLIADIRAQLGDEMPVMVVIDTLNRSIAGSESDDGDMGAYIKAADAVREAFGCAIVVVHHCGVDDRRPRGHTSLTGAADAQIAVKRDTSGTIVATVEWMKDGEEGAEIRSVLKVVEVGTDDDGHPITSCVVEPADDHGKTGSRSRKPITGQPKIALELLHRAIADGGQSPPASNHIPPGQIAVVPVDLWRRLCYAGLIDGRDNPDSQRRAFNRAAAKLQEVGAIGQWDGLVWPTS